MRTHIAASVIGALLACFVVVGGALAADPPTVSDFGVTGSPSRTGSLTFALTFSANVNGLDKADLSLAAGPGAATGCQIGTPAGGPASYTVAVSGCADGSVQLVLAAGAVSLVVEPGTTGPPEAASSVAGTVDRNPPTVNSFSVLTPAPVAGSTIEYALELSEPVSGLSAASFRIFPEVSSQPWSVTGISGSDSSYVVTLGRTTSTSGSVTLRLKKLAVTDAAGNAGPLAYRDAPAVAYSAPSGAGATVTINGGAPATSDPTLKLALSTSGLGSNVQMRFSIDNGSTWSAYEPFKASRDLLLPVRHPWGAVSVRGEFRDGAGTTAAANASIQYTQAQRGTMALKASYLIKANLDYSTGKINADQTVDLRNDSGQVIGWLDFSLFPRQFDKLAVSSVSVQGRSTSVTYTNKASMRVPLGFNLRPGESARVRIGFVATATSNTNDYQRSRLAKADGVMQVSSWHPLLSDGHGVRMPGDGQFSAAGDYRLELTHPRGVVVAAPGKLLSSSATTKVYTLDHAREYAFAVSPEFERLQATTAHGVKVEVYYRAGTTGGAAARNAAVKSLESHQQLGRYPWGRFVVAQASRTQTALEYSGMVFMGRAVMSNALTMSHEVAHQWWYGIVGNDQNNEPWLDEAFSEYTSRWYNGSAMPSYCSTKPVNSTIYEFPTTLTYGCDSYSQTVYHKGAVFLDGIRTRLGDAAFTNALKTIVAENRFGIVTTAKVRDTFLRYSANKSALNTYMNGFLRPVSGGTGGTDPVTKPQVSAPARALVAPQALGSTVVITVSWEPAVSSNPIKRYELQRKKGTAAWTSVSLPSPTATSVNVTVEPGANYRFRLRAVDSADTVGDWAATVAAKVSVAQENAASISYTGAWTRVVLSGASGGSVSHASVAGRVARLAFNGSSVAYTSTRGPGRGIAEVWLDGQRVDTIDLYAASVQKARVVWATTVAPGTHSLEVRVTGTKRPAASGTRVDVDAFLVHP